MPKQQIEDQDEESATSTWHNPTDYDVSIRLYKGHGHKPGMSHFLWKLAAGATKTLSSEYDNAIRLMREGVVVGGLAPQLIKIEEKQDPPEVHESLDVPGPKAHRGGHKPKDDKDEDGNAEAKGGGKSADKGAGPKPDPKA